MLNHHLAGLLGLGSLGWAGHQIHVSLSQSRKRIKDTSTTFLSR
jgi:hypothetical protein